MVNRTLRVVVVSPSDTAAELKALPAIVAEVNCDLKDRGLQLKLAMWETDAFPGFHPQGPQGIIDSVLKIEDCDILIGIFWKRFGKPVKDADSGTEHEIRKACAAWKERRRPQIMVYFCERAYSPETREETKQWGKVIDFKKTFPKEGLWWSYKSKREFESLVRQHLKRFLQNEYPAPLPPAPAGPPTSISLPGAPSTAGPAGPQPEADVDVVVSAVGTTITYSVVGSGFAAGEKVDMVLVKAGAVGADVSLGSATANASGAFELAVDNAKLSGIAAGYYTAKATGDKGSVASHHFFKTK